MVRRTVEVASDVASEVASEVASDVASEVASDDASDDASWSRVLGAASAPELSGASRLPSRHAPPPLLG